MTTKASTNPKTTVEHVEVSSAAQAPLHLTSREYQLVEIMEGMRGVRFTDVAKKAFDAIGLPSAQVASLLERLSHKGLIQRTGKQRHYTYTLLVNPQDVAVRTPKVGNRVLDLLVDELEKAKAREAHLVQQNRTLEARLTEVQALVPTLDTNMMARLHKLGVRVAT